MIQIKVLTGALMRTYFDREPKEIERNRHQQRQTEKHTVLSEALQQFQRDIPKLIHYFSVLLILGICSSRLYFFAISWSLPSVYSFIMVSFTFSVVSLPFLKAMP